ncbi:MAG: carboxypeptidase regulatory-like domain-containing protein [Euryarchaeota archaeon]|nr:carboxypeptidase regulatory-like domain-containing protein [Euryarchaeota archaeon]
MKRKEEEAKNMKLKGLPVLVIMVAMCAFTVQVAAQPTPFLISGWVEDSNGIPVNNPAVNISNTNTSNEWQAEAEAHPGHNYYQLILGTTNVSDGDVLEFNATNGMQHNSTNHTVTQENITDGGIFNFNITLSGMRHDINVSTDYTGAVNGIKITRDGSDVVGAEESLIIGENYNIRYKLVNEGDYYESVSVKVMVANETGWNYTIGTHTYSVNIGASNTYADSWGTTGLSPDNYNISVNASIPVDDNPENNERVREIILELPRAPDITSYAPASSVSDTEGATRTFNITVNQIVNVRWQINGTLMQTNGSVTEASYTNASVAIGTWNVSAIVTNANGTDMQTWIWKVVEAGAVPTADSFGVENASGRSGTYVELPVNVTNVMNGPILGIGFEIAYDKNVVNVTNVSKGNLVSDWANPNVNNNFTWGTKITIAGSYAADAIPNEANGSIVLLNFSVIGSPGDTSPMNMTLIELSNLYGVVGTAPAKNGTFVVPAHGAIADRVTYTCNETGIAGVVVNLIKEGAVVNTTMTNETGYYNFTDVSPDSYFVNASKLRFWDNSTEVTVTAGETITADMTLWLKGDLNGDGKSADTGDLVLMNRASVGEIAGDWRYDLNKNGIIADIGDLVLMNRASVKEIELL